MKAISYENTPWAIGDPKGRNRLRQRAQNLFGSNATFLTGRRVLDLACNNGRMAFGAIQAGAAHVTGIEIRDNLIEAGKKNIAEVDLESRMDFIKSDVFEFLEQATPYDYDIIMCLGFLYHTVRQADFFRECARLKPEAIIIDTSVAKNYFGFGRKLFAKPPALFLTGYENPKETRNTFDADGIVYWPSTSYLEEMFKRIGYLADRVTYNNKSVDDWSAMGDYRKGTRASYFARPLSETSP